MQLEGRFREETYWFCYCCIKVRRDILFNGLQWSQTHSFLCKIMTLYTWWWILKVKICSTFLQRNICKAWISLKTLTQQLMSHAIKEQAQRLTHPSTSTSAAVSASLPATLPGGTDFIENQVTFQANNVSVISQRWTRMHKVFTEWHGIPTVFVVVIEWPAGTVASPRYMWPLWYIRDICLP